MSFTLTRDKTGLLIVDVQEKLFALVDHPCEVMQTIQKVVKGFHILNIPIVATEQYPQGLGTTVGILKSYLGKDQIYHPKTSFSCLGDPIIRERISKMSISQWVLVGIEAHVCILQTAKDLIAAGKEVVVLNDAITSRSVFDFSTAIAELRDCGVRISSAETVLFELLRDAKSAEFKAMSELIK